MAKEILSQQEINRYQKLIALEQVGKAGQEKIKQASVLVVGAGGLGAPVLQYLSAIGIGSIGILDNDVIEMKNLPGQVLYGTMDLGKHKAIVAKQKLLEMNNLVEYNVHNICLSGDNAIGFIQEYDVVVDTTDNYFTKYLINDACVILKKKWVFAECDNFTGSYAVFDGKNGPTLRCYKPEKPKKAKVELPGEIGILTGVIGSFQASEVLKLITGSGRLSLGLVHQFNLLDNSLVTEEIKSVEENLQITSIIEN